MPLIDHPIRHPGAATPSGDATDVAANSAKFMRYCPAVEKYR
jgi:hypothetical protein